MEPSKQAETELPSNPNTRMANRAAPALPILILAALVAGVLGGGLGWAWGEWWYEHHQPSVEAATRAYDFRQLNLEQAAADAKNSAIAFSGFGVAFGLFSGLAGGLAARSTGRAILAGIIGLVIAGSVGGGVAYGMSSVYRKYEDPSGSDLLFPLLIHGVTWSAIAAVAGMAFGFGVGGRGGVMKGLLGGLSGALVAAVLFELTASILFPTHRTTQPISVSQESRLLARMLVSLVASFMVAITLRERRSKATI